MCAVVCVCARASVRACVSTLTSAVQTPHFTASAPLSIAPCSLYAPSLSFYFASTQPPPYCVARTAIYSSCVILTLISLCPPVTVSLSACRTFAGHQSLGQSTGLSLAGCQSVSQSLPVSASLSPSLSQSVSACLTSRSVSLLASLPLLACTV